tara:strand:- start:6244 stop:6462 length:219 start_codon:yes stop_codon:yes gene_type:complete
MYKFLSLVIVLSLFFQQTSYAYFDPGTGSYFIQLIIAFLASCYLFITNPIKFIKSYFKKNKKRNEIDKDKQE